MTEPYKAPKARFRITQESQVKWFEVRQLVATAFKTLAATVIGSMSGRRELMAALDPDPPYVADFSGQEDMWLDYVADTGDGWNATASIAWLVGRDAIALGPGHEPTPQPIPADCRTEADLSDEDHAHLLKRGEVLVFGGDEVYPTANAEAYQRRLVDPYKCARYSQNPPRTVLALPGNHDWYDGLTSFIRLFCQRPRAQRWLGAWGTQQRRSYFAIKLPHGWWLWGVDMALEDDLDPSQYDYFRDRSEDLQEGDRVILCVPTPVWLKWSAAEIRADRSKFRIADKLRIVSELARGSHKKATVPAIVTGDNHYYAHHLAQTSDGPRHYIVSGGGGAFGLGTLQVPETVEIPFADSDVTARQQTIFPTAAESRRLRRGALGFPRHNVVFTSVLVLAQFVTLWLLSVAIGPGANGCGIKGRWVAQAMCTPFSWDGLLQAGKSVGPPLLQSPGLDIWLAVVLVGYMALAWSGHARDRSPALALLVGLLHGLLQVAGVLACVWLMAHLVMLVPGGDGTAFQWLTVPLTFPLAYVYAGLLFGAYLLLGHKWFGLHDQEVFSSQGIEDYKCFLRMHISSSGLTIYPVGLRKAARRWKPAEGVKATKVSGTGSLRVVRQVQVPEGCSRVFDPGEELAPHLIEEPIEIPSASVP